MPEHRVALPLLFLAVGEKYKTKIENAEGGHDEHFVTIEKIYVCKGKGEGAAAAAGAPTPLPSDDQLYPPPGSEQASQCASSKATSLL